MPVKSKMQKNQGAAPELGTRIRQWRKTVPIKGYELSALLGVSQGSLSDIENNKSLPSADTLARFHRKTEVNIVWLLMGRGPMVRHAVVEQNEMDVISHNKKVRPLLEKFAEIYERANTADKRYLEGLLAGWR